MPRIGRILSIIFLLTVAVPFCAQAPYRAQIEKWRQSREASLTRDGGWLSVAGLFWLKEGENTAGTASSNRIVLPRGSAPARVGAFVFHGGKTLFRAEPGAGVTSGGKPVQSLEMHPDVPGPANFIAIGGLSMQVIKRGSRYGIRLRDSNSRFRREFKGLHWFPVAEAWRIRARFVPYYPAKKIAVPNILGDTDQELSPGYASFQIDGKEHRLDPIGEGNQLFFIFRDQTSGKETYPAGRFLYADGPRNGHVVLDFNTAYNPPCAFTPYATCPLPPAQNRLAVRIPAGELTHHPAAPRK